MVEIRHKKSGVVLLRIENEALTRSDLAGLNLPGADLHRAALRGANLQSTNLTGADLSHADLTEADLQDALLAEADLRGTNLDGAQLRGADLTRVVYSRETCWPDGALSDAREACLSDEDEERKTGSNVTSGAIAE